LRLSQILWPVDPRLVGPPIFGLSPFASDLRFHWISSPHIVARPQQNYSRAPVFAPAASGVSALFSGRGRDELGVGLSL
jgi:hypothetical protein